MRTRNLIVVVGALGLLTGCGVEEESEPILRPVRYVQVFRSGGVRVRSFAGVAQASVESGLSFRVSGTVQRIAVVVGDSVRTGGLIAQLDPEDYRLQVQDAEAALRRAEAESRNADANYDRVRGLWENNNASQSELDGARAGAEAAAEAVESARNRLGLARRQLTFTRLRAPQPGAIASVPVEVNENVRSGRVVAVLTSGSELEVSVAVPEALIAGVQEGAPVTVTFDAIPEREFTAIVHEVGVITGGTGTAFPVTVRLTGTDPAIRPGMAAEVKYAFPATAGRNIIIVPPIAVSEDQNGRYVYVVEPGQDGVGVVRRRDVSVGELTTDGFEILEGLDDEDRVITAGMSQITDGLRVKIQPTDRPRP